MQELTQLQEKHSTRPDVFDEVEEEQEIEILTSEITKVIYTCICIMFAKNLARCFLNNNQLVIQH